MTKIVTVAALQTTYGPDMAANIARTEALVREAAAKGAQIILPSELFQGEYFCVSQEERWFATAFAWREHPCVIAMQKLAAELDVVIPTSIYEKEGPHYFNSLVMVDAGGEALGVYRKSHIPDGPGYQEKYYFRPGDTGFKVWDTKYARVGVGICWDQWYPEAARSMALAGADILMYPTAIGSEPHDAELDTAAPWQRVMQGHAVANVMPVVASNRIGTESLISPQNGAGQSFYGHSFIANHRGDKLAEFGAREEGVLVASFDLDYLNTHRAAWGFFRDRRPELYSALSSPRPA
ncbi:N-carbamoylputrescine amidase [Asticcacaulis sp. EMRT-3]|uniref:N-carbamoylputrescine amidase n=1 Tax=Asticcacaulis sp. EMRT-3 TaxID=3040349 RepID=UPI0024AEED47|nr:N-carbamoylputrescine amidase [Asticcacaulis sp. EMRT-3]MDI7776208.1 N-carbamoylputrescine amidase [Asticcacaulis sp. EMRT-3]